MDLYAQVLSYAIPGFVLLIIIEAIAAHFMGMKINNGMDVISSLSSGMTNTLKSILKLGIVIISYGWMVDNFAVMEIESTFWLYLVAFVGIDFASYWSHRFNHVVNLFWNRHIVHHSSEEFNLSCALRQSISGLVGIYFFLYIPLAIIGIPSEVINIMAPLHLFAQFWYHTRLIGRMGFLEHILVTPSHHRVHHAINAEYIDKNYAAIFIVWDKWFGTFQEELEEIPAVYGTKVPVETWNPILINFMHVWSLIKDAWRTQNWWDKLRIWFMPTGWRPDDVKEKFPMYYVEDASIQVKYQTEASQLLKTWSWAQLIINNLFLFYILIQLGFIAEPGDFSFADIVLYCTFVFVSIFAYTTLMDRHLYAVPAEFVKLALGLFLIYQQNGWYGMDEVFGGATIMVTAYMAISFAVTLYVSYFEKQVSPENA